MMAQSATRYLQSSYNNVGWRQEGHPTAKKTTKTTDVNLAYERVVE